MKVNRFALLGVLMLVLVVRPLLVVAQDDDKVEVDTSEWVEFTSEDEIFTVMYPPDWFAGSGEGPGSLFIVNNELLLETMETDDPALPGDKVVAVIALLPANMLALMGIELEEESTSLDLIEGMAAMLQGESADDEEDDTEIGEPEILELSDGAEVGVISVKSESDSFEGFFLAHQTEDGLIFFGLAATYLGEYDEEFEATAIAILDNMEINITAEDLMEMMGS